jgi:hypothetical protein
MEPRYRPLPYDFVPEGKSTSRFQASNAPARRKDTLRRAMLAPQSTEPLVALTVGISSRSRDQVEHLRRELPAALAAAVDIDAREITIGPCRAVKGHGGFHAPAMPNTTCVDPQPRWIISVYIDEATYDIEDIAMLGNELYLTILEGSHDGLRRLGVHYAEPPQAEMESIVDQVSGQPVEPADYDAVAEDIAKRLMEVEAADAAASVVGKQRQVSS